MCEAALNWWDSIAVNYNKVVLIRNFGFIRTIFLNLALTLVVVILFFASQIDWLLYAILITAGWLKYIVCKIPSIIEDADTPYIANKYELRKL